MSDNNKTSDKASDKKKICIVVNPLEYELIAANARSVGRMLTAYVKEVAINRIVIHNNYDAVLEYTKVMNRMRSDINAALNSYAKSGIVYPADLKHIEYLLKEVSENQRKLLQQTERDRDLLRKDIKKLHQEAGNVSEQ